MSVLADARDAVLRSEQSQARVGKHALRVEVEYLRYALRALITEVEDLRRQADQTPISAKRP